MLQSQSKFGGLKKASLQTEKLSQISLECEAEDVRTLYLDGIGDHDAVFQ